jgi:sulfate permease, SulP family
LENVNEEKVEDKWVVKNISAQNYAGVDTVLLDMEATSHLDLSSADMLAELVGELKAQGIDLLLANVRTPIRDLLERSGVAQVIGEKRIYPSIEEAVEGFNGEGKEGT